jgi:putative ATP-binding cassette transporter
VAEWLTRRFLDRYLARRTYLRLAGRADIDNPDERISEDVKTFTTTTMSIFVLSVNGIVTVLAFSSVLWLITPWLFVAAFGYALAGSVGTLWLGRHLITLNNRQLRKEADFRYGLGRVREHAEAVAQAAGEPGQRRRLDRWLARLVENFREVVRVTRNLSFFTVAYKYMPQIIPAAIVAPLYFRKSVPFGAVTQAAMAFSQVQGAFQLFVTQFQEVTTYAAVIDRLGALWEATAAKEIEPAPESPLPRAPKKSGAPPARPADSNGKPGAPRRLVVEISADTRRMLYEHVTLWTAERDGLLLNDLSIEVSEGQRYAVTGPGPATEAVLLATAGLWIEGRGRISRPGPGGIMFVARRPSKASGPLRDILRERLGRELPDTELLAVLKKVGLARTVAQKGGPEREQDWAAVLSPAELQALTFARLLLAGPRFAVLDSPDGELESSGGERLYHALADSSITYITVGCPANLLKYHSRRLDLDEHGGWRVEPIASESHSSVDDNT